MAEQEARTFYRSVRHNPPQYADFLSNAVLGKPPPHAASPETLHAWQSCISVQDTLAGARRLAGRVHFLLGRFVAAIAVEPSAPIIAAPSFGPGRFSLEGAPAELLHRVLSVESALVE